MITPQTPPALGLLPVDSSLTTARAGSWSFGPFHPVTPTPTSISRFTDMFMDTAAFSPVNQYGCFDFDRVIKSGEVLKKGRKTKNYKSNYLVLRLLNLSIYADREHTALRHCLPLNEISAVARRRKHKKPRPGLFTVFTAPRDYHFDASDEKSANEWVNLLKLHARIDELDSRLGTSEEETEAAADQVTTFKTPSRTAPINIDGAQPTSRSRQIQGRYGVSKGSFSSISSLEPANTVASSTYWTSPVQEGALNRPPDASRSPDLIEPNQERVIRNGYLHLLKRKGGVKKWKPTWAVLRPKSLAIYPNNEEYLPLVIISFSSLVNAVEIDSPSRSKRRQFCMQIITEERNWRFCAQDEEDLAQWLGVLKSMLAQRRAAEDAAVELQAAKLS